MRKRSAIRMLSAALTLTAASAGFSPAGAAEEVFSAKLRGGNETPLTLGTAATGVFSAQLDSDETSLTFQLFYDGIEGGAVSAAHIHLGRPGTTGGIVIHFCGTGGTAPCPASPGFLTGVVTAANVVAVPAQGIAAGDFARVIRAMRKGDTYANVHTATFSGGEIRGAIE
jgi:hypothetical protein